MRRVEGGDVITFELSPDVLGNTRYTFSPLTEVTLSLRLLGRPSAGHVHRPWLRLARDRLEGVDTELLLAVVPPSKWVANCLVQPATAAQPTIEDELDELIRMPPDVLARDVGEVWPQRPPPERVRRLLESGVAAAGELADALWAYWDAVIRPFWPRMCAVLEDDVDFRAAALVDGGMYEMYGDLHGEITLAVDRMRIDKPHHASHVCTARAMVLTPSVFGWPDLILKDGEEGTFGLIYPTRGVARVWEGAGLVTIASNDRLGALLGRTRAAILDRTRVPLSTTQIARDLGQSPATVSGHLSVLRDNGLVTSRRAGRTVLYRQTPLAESMFQPHPPGAAASGSVAEERKSRWA